MKIFICYISTIQCIIWSVPDCWRVRYLISDDNLYKDFASLSFILQEHKASYCMGCPINTILKTHKLINSSTFTAQNAAKINVFTTSSF